VGKLKEGVGNFDLDAKAVFETTFVPLLDVLGELEAVVKAD